MKSIGVYNILGIGWMVGIGARHVLGQFEGHFQVGEEGWDYVHALGKGI